MAMIRRVPIVLAGMLVSCLLVPSLALATAGDDTFSTDAYLSFDNGIQLTVLGGATADSISNDGVTVSFDMGIGTNILTIKAQNGTTRLNNDGNYQPCVQVLGITTLVMTEAQTGILHVTPVVGGCPAAGNGRSYVPSPSVNTNSDPSPTTPSTPDGSTDGNSPVETVTPPDTTVPPVVTPVPVATLPSEANWNTNTQRYEALDSGVRGNSPYDGSSESISTVMPGWYIRAEHYDTVYYVDSQLHRHPFWNVPTFFTWSDSWKNVVWVTDATLPTLTIDSAMIPKPGAVLVKQQDDPQTYALSTDEEGRPSLRLLPDEAVATTLFGSDWNQFVLDVEPTIFHLFVKGTSLSTTTDTSLLATHLLSRPTLLARAQK